MKPSHIKAPHKMWVDATITENFKVDELLEQRNGPKAFVAYIELLGWSVRQLTDGYIPPKALRLCHRTTKALVDQLVAARLLQEYGDGWVIPDFLEYQKASASWVEEGEKRYKAGRIGSCRRWHDDTCRCLEGQPITYPPNSDKGRSDMAPAIAPDITSAIARALEE